MSNVYRNAVQHPLWFPQRGDRCPEEDNWVTAKVFPFYPLHIEVL